MTPTRLALLSPAAGSRQCRASTDLGRGPHVSSSLHLHLPISPLPSSLLSLSLPSFFHLSLSFFLDYSFASSFSSLPLFLKICSFHIPSTNPPWRRQTKSSQPQEAAQPLAKLDAINTGVAEELHASLQPPLPHLLAALARCGQHTPQAHKGNAGQPPCSRHDTDTRHRPMRAMRKQCPRQAWHSSWAHLHKGKLHFLKTDFLEVWCILRFFL